MFDHRVAGDNVTVIKSPYYYDQKDVHLDKIVFKAMATRPPQCRARGGGHPGARQRLAGRAAGVQQNTSLRVLAREQLGWRGIIINIGNKNGVGNLPYTNVGTPLASSPKLRQAFEEAIDRNALNKVVFARPHAAGCTPMSPASTACTTPIKVPCTPYNPRDAKKLVAKSGFPNPTVHLLTGNTTDMSNWRSSSRPRRRRSASTSSSTHPTTRLSALGGRAGASTCT